MVKPHLKQDGNDFLVYESLEESRSKLPIPARIPNCKTPKDALRTYYFWDNAFALMQAIEKGVVTANK